MKKFPSSSPSTTIVHPYRRSSSPLCFLIISPCQSSLSLMCVHFAKEEWTKLYQLWVERLEFLTIILCKVSVSFLGHSLFSISHSSLLPRWIQHHFSPPLDSSLVVYLLNVLSPPPPFLHNHGKNKRKASCLRGTTSTYTYSTAYIIRSTKLRKHIASS